MKNWLMGVSVVAALGVASVSEAGGYGYGYGYAPYCPPTPYQVTEKCKVDGCKSRYEYTAKYCDGSKYELKIRHDKDGVRYEEKYKR